MMANPYKLTLISQPEERPLQESEGDEQEQIIQELELDIAELERDMRDVSDLEKVIAEYPEDVANALQEVLDRTSDDRVLRKRVEAFTRALRRESNLTRVGVSSPSHRISNLVILSLQGAPNPLR